MFSPASASPPVIFENAGEAGVTSKPTLEGYRPVSSAALEGAYVRFPGYPLVTCTQFCAIESI